MATAAELLAGLSRNRLAAPDEIDPLVAAEANQKLLQDEAKNNLEKVGRYPLEKVGRYPGGGFATGAIQADTESADDPWTGTQARADAQKAQEQYQSDVRYQQPGPTQQRKDVLANTLAPVYAKSAGDLAVEQEKQRGALAVEKAKQDPMLEFMKRGGQPGSDAFGNQTVTATVGPGGMTLKQNQVPQQVQAQAHAAQVGLALYPEIKQRIMNAVQSGVTGPIMGNVYGAATSGTLPGALLSYLTPGNKQQAFTTLNTDLSLLKSNLAYAHGAARGGSSPAMQQRFDKLFNVGMGTPALVGSIDAAERWLSTYAAATDNFTHMASPEQLAALDAMDAQLLGGATAVEGVAPGQAPGQNQGVQ